VAANNLITERDFAQAVVEYARATGWLVWRTWNSKHSPAGEPDLRMVRPPRVIYAELKRERGRLTPAQEQAIDLLDKCPGVETYLWKPSDWPRIEKILAQEVVVAATHTSAEFMRVNAAIQIRHPGGRPRLEIPMRRIVEALRHEGNKAAAARALGCSAAYIRKRLKEESGQL